MVVTNDIQNVQEICSGTKEGLDVGQDNMWKSGELGGRRTRNMMQLDTTMTLCSAYMLLTRPIATTSQSMLVALKCCELS